MSETFCACIVTPPGSSNGARTGKPLAGVTARLRTPTGEAAAAGERGELWLRHPALALRLRQPAGADRSAIPATAGSAPGTCSSQDAEGFFSHQGRSDEMVKIAGQWVQPGELEEAVAGDPAIAEAACVQVTDAEGFERLAMFVAARGEAAHALAAAAQRICEEKLPRFKRPKWIRARRRAAAHRHRQGAALQAARTDRARARREDPSDLRSYCAAIRLASNSGSLRRRSDSPSNTMPAAVHHHGARGEFQRHPAVLLHQHDRQAALAAQPEQHLA